MSVNPYPSPPVSEVDARQRQTQVVARRGTDATAPAAHAHDGSTERVDAPPPSA